MSHLPDLKPPIVSHIPIFLIYSDLYIFSFFHLTAVKPLIF